MQHPDNYRHVSGFAPQRAATWILLKADSAGSPPKDKQASIMAGRTLRALLLVLSVAASAQATIINTSVSALLLLLDPMRHVAAVVSNADDTPCL